MTLGPAGALVLQEELAYRPAPVGQVVDTLGAGDAFIATLLVGLAAGQEIGALLSAATAYATASLRQLRRVRLRHLDDPQHHIPMNPLTALQIGQP